MACRVELDKIANLVTVRVIRKDKPTEDFMQVTEEELRLGRVPWPRWLMRMAQKKLKEHAKNTDG